MLETTCRPLSGKPSARVNGLRASFRNACLALAAIALPAQLAEGQKITEVVADHVGVDTHEYIEIAANPGNVVPPGVSDTVIVDLSAYRIVEVDGSTAGSGNPGRILHVFTPALTNSSGLWSTGYLTSTLERPAFTILLVSGFSGAVGDDLDPGNDGVLDTSPWSAIADGVAFSDGTPEARTYAAPVLGPGFDGGGTAPGGASRFPYYTDTESTADWKRNDFDGAGLPGTTGTLAAGEARNTPASLSRVHVADFYAAVDTSSQAALRSTIHTAVETHLRFPYTASTIDTWDILNSADQDPVDPGSILDIYKNETYTKISGGTGVYNREHSWPNSYGFNNNEAVSEYTDCHHLFASDTTYNSNRGNQPFGTCSASATENATALNHGFGGGSGTYPGNSNWDNGSRYEVWNHRRGDLARAQFYMDVRYEGGTHPYTGASEQNLILTSNASLIQTNQPYMGILSTLIQWHLEDPVDDDERARNEVIESYQGNRNPFVDHPEWVECVFQGTGCQVVTGPPTVTTSAATGVTIAAATLNATVNPNGLATEASFEWGLTTAYGQTTTPVSLGSGSAAVPLTANLASLAGCTTYHFRATATNSGGTTIGGDLSFTTTCPAPIVTTTAATGITTGGATLNASVNPNGLATNASFEWGLTAAYGQTTTPVAVGSGSSAVPLTAGLTGLVGCTTYHFRATGTNSAGTTNGGDLSFTTSCPAPTVVTNPATGIVAGGATLNASVNPNGLGTNASFEWGLTTAYGQATAPVAMGSGSSAVPLTAGLTSLIGCTTYHFRVTATSAGGTSYGSDRSFTTSCPVPTVSTNAATAVTIGGATLNASVNPNGLSTSASFQWGLTTAYGQTTTPSAMGSGTSAVLLAADLAGLAGCTTYHFRAAASNSGGTSNGGDQSFTTTCPGPTVVTNAATAVTIGGATLNATVNPNGLSTNASFQWGLTTAYGQVTAPAAMGSGTSAQSLAAGLATLAGCTTYHFRATATSSAGTTTGGDLSFTTSCPAPVVATNPATAVTDGTATLNASVNPNGLATNASFEWGLTTAYGEATAPVAMGSGSSALPVSAALTDLEPCSTYHYRAKATSAGGDVTGNDASFETACPTGRFFPLAPCRVLDTRNDSAMIDGVAREVAFHGSCAIPTTARALAANVTVTQPTLSGHVSIYPADAASTGTSTVHFAAGRTRAASTILKLSEDGTGRARIEATVPTGGTTHVIVDVSGYFD